jgi:hypothetical protein
MTLQFFRCKYEDNMILVFLNLSTHNMISSSIHFPTNNMISFFFMMESYFIVCICYIFFIHSLIDGHLGWFYNLPIVNNAVVNMGRQVSLLYASLPYSGCITRSCIATSYGRVFFLFCFLAALQLISNFYSGCANLHSYQQCISSS